MTIPEIIALALAIIAGLWIRSRALKHGPYGNRNKPEKPEEF